MRFDDLLFEDMLFEYMLFEDMAPYLRPGLLISQSHGSDIPGADGRGQTAQALK
jgi:hypothetical protein